MTTATSSSAVSSKITSTCTPIACWHERGGGLIAQTLRCLWCGAATSGERKSLAFELRRFAFRLDLLLLCTQPSWSSRCPYTGYI